MKRSRDHSAEIAAKRIAAKASSVVVNTALLEPNCSYGFPDYVTRGCYLDKPFTCKHCGKPEIWTTTQQKWSYESAKGDLWTVAVRCRACRRRERDRKAEARRVHLAGVARKKAEKP